MSKTAMNMGGVFQVIHRRSHFSVDSIFVAYRDYDDYNKYLGVLRRILGDARREHLEKSPVYLTTRLVTSVQLMSVSIWMLESTPNSDVVVVDPTKQRVGFWLYDGSLKMAKNATKFEPAQWYDFDQFAME